MTEPLPAETISVPEFRLNSILVKNKKNDFRIFNGKVEMKKIENQTFFKKSLRDLTQTGWKTVYLNLQQKFINIYVNENDFNQDLQIFCSRFTVKPVKPDSQYTVGVQIMTIFLKIK